MMRWATVSIVFLSAPAAAQNLDLHLVCRGSGASNLGNEASITTRNLNTGETTATTITDNSGRGFDDDVRIELTGVGGRIHLPQALMPAVRGGKNGWFDLRNVVATQDDITGVATINLFNKIKLHIDRITGAASFTTLNGSFQGQCISYDPRSERRAF